MKKLPGRYPVVAGRAVPIGGTTCPEMCAPCRPVGAGEAIQGGGHIGWVSQFVPSRTAVGCEAGVFGRDGTIPPDSDGRRVGWRGGAAVEHFPECVLAALADYHIPISQTNRQRRRGGRWGGGLGERVKVAVAVRHYESDRPG